jgi:hypothetical protein
MGVMGNEERNFMQMYFHDFRDCERACAVLESMRAELKGLIYVH